MERERNEENNERTTILFGRVLKIKEIYGLTVLFLIVVLVLVLLTWKAFSSQDPNVWYTNVFFAGFMITFTVVITCWYCFCGRSERGETSTVNPRGLQAAPTAPEQRIPEAGQRQNTDPARRPSTPSRAALLDIARGAPGIQNPVVLYSSEQSCRNLQFVHERTQSESSFSQERILLLRSLSAASSEATQMSGVALEMSDIASKKTTGRERIRTRSMTRQQLSEASTSPAGQPMDPSVPGPSHLHTPEFHGLGESSVRQLRSSKKKTETESQRSDRRGVRKSPVSGRSTGASGGVRRREKFATRKGSVDKKLDSDDSESADSELE